MNKSEAEAFRLICKQLELSAFFFYEMTLEMYYSLIIGQEGFEGNVMSLDKILTPIVADSMVFPSLSLSQSQKNKTKK